jgi:hypothetical protein
MLSMKLKTNLGTRFIPVLEGLEAREVPAVQIFVTDHVLHVLGDGHANIVGIHDNGEGKITVDAGSEHFTASGIHEVKIATEGGGDRVNYQLTGPLKTTEKILANLGKGSDKAVFNFSEGVAAGGHLKLKVEDGAGADRDKVTIGSIAKGGSAVLQVHGGKGNDTIDFHSFGKVAGHLVASFHGDSGHNTQDIHSTAQITGKGNVNIKSS